MNTSKGKNLHPYPDNLVMQHVLTDNTHITIRPIRENDAEIIKEFGRHLSNELKHLNYMETFKELPQSMVTRLTQVDYKKSMTLIATHANKGNETVIGMAHYKSTDGINSEFDMIVTDAWQNKGIGSKLTKALLKSAEDNGIKSIQIIILGSNRGGMMLARNFGFSIENSDEPTVKIVTKKL